MPILKTHSEQSAVASVAKGWKLRKVFYHGEDIKGYEYLLERTSDELSKPSEAEIFGWERAYRIEELFSIEGRGLVALPGTRFAESINISDQDTVVVIGGQKAAMFSVSTTISMNLKSKNDAILLRSATRDQIEDGSFLWTRRGANKTQHHKPDRAG